MKNFLRCKSVGGGLMQLLDDYCNAEGVISPINRKYHIDERVSFETWLKCLQQIYLKNPIAGLGIQIGKYIQPSHVGVLAYIAQSCETLEQFFALSSRYVNIWYNFTPLKVDYIDEQIEISWEQPAYIQTGVYVHETALSQELMTSIIWHRLEQLIGINQVHFISVDLAMPKPADDALYKKFNCPIHFQAKETKVCLPKQLLEIPLQHPDPVLFRILHQQADQNLADMPEEDAFMSHVKMWTLESIKNQRAFIDYVADKMNISPRQLQKLLKDHGMSFQQCLNEVRLQLAQQYLQDSQLSIIDITLLLSYSEPASFNRAFKSWTGLNPSQWRQQYTATAA